MVWSVQTWMVHVGAVLSRVDNGEFQRCGNATHSGGFVVFSHRTVDSYTLKLKLCRSNSEK